MGAFLWDPVQPPEPLTVPSCRPPYKRVTGDRGPSKFRVGQDILPGTLGPPPPVTAPTVPTTPTPPLRRWFPDRYTGPGVVAVEKDIYTSLCLHT